MPQPPVWMECFPPDELFSLFFLDCPSVQPQIAREKPSLLSAPCSRRSCSAAPLLVSDQHEEACSRCAKGDTLPLHSSGTC